jgi:cytochrome P450
MSNTPSSGWPDGPIAAVSHPDPYPYYADLVARRPFYHDASLGLWVASKAETVAAVLGSELCLVRPAAEPVPTALIGTPAADVFRHLIRMNDGPGRCPLKRAVSSAFDQVDAAEVGVVSARCARSLAIETSAASDLQGLDEFARRLPVLVMASLLGFSQAPAQVEHWVGDLVRSFAPGAGATEIVRGGSAAGSLLDLFRARLTIGRPGEDDDLFTLVVQAARRAGCDHAMVLAANGVGFLTQSYEATAALIGNTLLALGTHPEIVELVSGDRALLPPLVREVMRYDAPVQNTRRFVRSEVILSGQKMAAGDSVLVILGAANRDPAVNPFPRRLVLGRADPRVFGFGAGSHACPGAAFATTIAAAGVEVLLRAGLEPRRLTGSVTYRPSPNVRMPLFRE